MALLPWPSAAWQLGALIVLAAPAIGILWSPAIATLSDGAERHGIEQAIAFAFVNVAWAFGQTAGAAGSARLAEATSDRVPYLLLAAASRADVLRPPARSIASSPAMAAEVIDGKAIAQAVRAEVRADVAAWVAQGNPRPGLATVLVGDDPASAVYIGGKQKASAEAGIEGFDHRLAHDTGHEEVSRLLQRLNDDPAVSGILLQLPTPPQVDGAALTELIDPAKDVDGLTPISAGLLAKGRPGLRPCTPAGVMELLRRHDVALEGAEAVVVGRSDLVGKPLSALLLAANATVTTCHSRTRDLAAVCRRADVLVAAVGRPEFVRGDWVKEGGGDRRRHQPHGRRPRRRRRLRGGRRARRADHARPRRRGPDDDRDAAAQHPAGGEGAGGVRRVRAGEIVAGAAGVLLLVSLFLDWYSGRGRDDGLSAWAAFGVRRPPAGARRPARDRARAQPGRRPRARAARRARRDHDDARARRVAAACSTGSSTSPARTS